uniref:TMV resistance protein N n=1 Tax=Cajanus cajan TaxID=3821 RepID=A0A151T6I7_CAJCA|nr:TMV resistance protein N [Cajanus cajan]
MAMHQAANLSGYHFKQGVKYEFEFIKEIVELVSSKINRAPLHVADYPVGLESQVLRVKLLLDIGSDDVVHMVGIHGLGGVGKTTLAVAVCNSIADHFEALCFLENVRETAGKHGLQHVQSNLLSEVVGEKEIKLTSVKQGISIIQHRLQQKKVLLIVDDVDKMEQLHAIVGRSDWFGHGSRIIVTTRDKQLLACHGVKRTYELKELNKEHALQLLCWKAFKLEYFDPCYHDVLNRAITYVSGLPLALEVIGSNLFGKSIEQWECALNRYERIPNKEIQEILRVSYDALDEDEQSVFLDIACCYKEYELAEVEDILHAHYDHCMKHQIGVLVQKSLIKITFDGKVTLHDLIEDMGKEIVRQESPKEPGKRSRLWFSKDIVEVLQENKGTSQTEIIFMDFSLFEKVEWDGYAFKRMKNLKTLIIRSGHFSKGPKHLPNILRVLEWWRYPSQDLPFDFHPKKLVICKLPKSSFSSLELAAILLKKIPDLSCLPQLEKLSFQLCQNLFTVHYSVGFLEKLKILNGLGCIKLKSFPPIKLTSLEQLELSFCIGLKRFPEILGKMENITPNGLEETRIKKISLSFKNLTQLQQLYVMRGVSAKRVSSTTVFSNVQRLRLRSCNLSDDFFPTVIPWFANVKELDLSSNNFTVIPECIKQCNFLTRLYLDNCERLQEIRGIPPNLKHFSAIKCLSLTSSCRSMFLSQVLFLMYMIWTLMLYLRYVCLNSSTNIFRIYLDKFF